MKKLNKKSGFLRRIKVGPVRIIAFFIPLQSKNLILLKGSKGYVMCGYLNLKAAGKFRDAAIKVTGVTSIEEALQTRVHSCTPQARKLGVSKGMPIKEAVKLIA